LVLSDVASGGYNPATYFLAGAICASLSHTIAIPIDVVKTRQQTEVDLQDMGPVEALKAIVMRDGPQSLLQGSSPTIVGYALQGCLKYGLYEYLKPIVAASLLANSAAGSAGSASTILDFLISGALAESVAVTVLTPFEAARIRTMCYPDYVAEGGGVAACLAKMGREEGVQSLYLGLLPLFAKQIPYTAVSLCVFEVVSKYLYASVLGVGTALVSNPAIGSAVSSIGGELANSAYGDSTVITSAATAAVSMESIPGMTRFGVTFASAALAGLLGAVVSQPGDTLVTVINKEAKSMGLAQAPGGKGGAVSASVSRARGGRGVAAAAAGSSASSADEEGSGRGSAEEGGTLSVSPFALMVRTAQQLGLQGLYAGFGARLLHVLVIVVSQLLIYDASKEVVGAWFR
jgi:solute carrier family 25 phosphate transporter 3